MRLYRISEYLTFLGDEGRDVLIVKRMIVDHKFTLLGPITSVGSIYMGPIYYYFMVPALWLARMNPVGPAIMVVTFAMATIWLIYRTGSEFLSKSSGLIASLFYAISPLAIIYGRSSWNPNVVPFFSLLLIYSLLCSIVKKKPIWFLVAGGVLGVLIQLHYVTLMFIPIFITVLLFYRKKIEYKYLMLGLIFFILAFSPFILFELRHGFVNINSAWRFMLQQKNETTGGLMAVISTGSDIFVRLFWRLLVVENAQWTKILILIISAVLFNYFIKYHKNFIKINTLLIFLIWLVVGIGSFALYRGVIYDYYLGSLFTLPFLLLGVALTNLWQEKLVFKALVALMFLLLIFFNIKNSPLKIEPNNMLGNTKTISQFVLDKAVGKPYNFALIAARNSDHAYRYFLETWNRPPVTIENPVIDPERKTVTDQLLVICEEKICQPLGHSLWEIAGFGRAEIAGEWNIITVKVFKLVHYREI